MNGLVIQSDDGGGEREVDQRTDRHTDQRTLCHGRQMGLPVPVNNRNTFSPPSEIMIEYHLISIGS